MYFCTVISRVRLCPKSSIMNVAIVLVWVCFVAIDIVNCQQQQLSPIVSLDGGQVQGLVQQVDEQNVNFYQGIRYGQAKRFARAKQVDSWNGIYNATTYAFACPQIGFELTNVSISSNSPIPLQSSNLTQTQFASEDCLYLNIWSPAQNQTTNSTMMRQNQNRPVMVWFQSDGTIFNQAYDGRYLASIGNVVVVAVQSRPFNPFGFLFADDDEENLGIQDQILALKWIQRNINAFGGDRGQMTIFGEGSGAISVGALILSPKSESLFQRAILQSGSPISPMGVEDKGSGWAKTRMLASLLDCNESKERKLLQCLQTKSVDEILNASSAMAEIGQRFRPVFGEDILPASPVETLLNGKFKNRNIDIMFGVDANAGNASLSLLLPQSVNGTSELTVEGVQISIRSLLTQYNIPYVDNVIQYYAANITDNQTALREVLPNLNSDLAVNCPVILYGEQIAQTVPANKYYSYRLESTLSSSETLNCSSACPSAEVAYLFGSAIASNTSAQDVQLSRDMIRSWAQFATSGTPGQIGSTQWAPAFLPNSFVTQFISINGSSSQMVINGFYEQSCDIFWKPKLFSLYRYGSDD